MPGDTKSPAPSEPNSPHLATFPAASAPSTPATPSTALPTTDTAGNPFSTPASSRPSSVRPRTATSSYSINSVPRSILNQSSHTPLTSPIAVFPRHSTASASGMSTPTSAWTNGARTSALPPKKLPRMRSHMIPEGTEFPKPWAVHPPARATFSYYLVYALIFLGAIGGGILTYFQYKNVELDRQPLCLVMEEDFSNPSVVFDTDGSGKGTFFREVGMEGNGNGEFSMTTSSQNNSFVQDGHLYIVPTLTSDNLPGNAIFDGTIYNITGCTFNVTRPDFGYVWKWNDKTAKEERVFDEDGYLKSCSAIGNATAGTVVNPVQSARLITKFNPKGSVKFGRVEVRAKMPRGDWMWPAIWMLPRDEKYGAWPLSGEIDIVESRGNSIRYTARGANYVQGALNWGPAPGLNGVGKSYSWWTDKRKPFNDGFHTYALEWTKDFIRIYVDTRLHTLLDLRFNKPFFQRGEFPETIFNGSSLVPLSNPWINGTNATPFDQEFYLILNVAVGSTTGWFPEGQGDKPWLDRAQNPMLDFAKAEPAWYRSWPGTAAERGMVVDYVKMWNHCDGK